MLKKARAKIIDRILNKLYPHPKPALNFKTRYQLLAAVVLSAQCTDERVNEVTERLFDHRPGPKAVLDLGPEALIAFIRPCGLHHAKAKSILGLSRILIEKYKGELPDNFDDLVKLPGVGQKTADVVLAQGFGKPAFPVDTHIFRVARRLDLSKKTSANKLAEDLKKLFPVNRWKDLHLQFIFHGRQVCHARKPECAGCKLLKVCPAGQGFERSRKVGKKRIRNKE